MTWLEVLFWGGATCVVYPYVVYPSILGILARIKQRRSTAALYPSLPDGETLPTVSVILAVYNEDPVIDRRLGELVGLIEALHVDGEVIVVSDGSTDHTVEKARRWSQVDDRVRVIALDSNRGKAAALNTGCALARHEILAFADARQVWAPDALRCLLENFADSDSEVGAVSGELVIESAAGIMRGVSLYWRFEKWIRRQESVVASTVGVTGAISAVRKSLFRSIPPGTILDDVYWPLGVALQGYRVRHDARARAYDRLPERVHDEFRRKVRTLSGNYQLMALLPAALVPARNPVWIQFLSHKILRLAVPWALLVTLVSSGAMSRPIYRAAFWIQVLFYLLAVTGCHRSVANRFRPAAAAASFVVLNAAAWLAFWAWASGRTTHLWHKSMYRRTAPLNGSRVDGKC